MTTHVDSLETSANVRYKLTSSADAGIQILGDDSSIWQPCPLCDGKGGIVRFAGGGSTVAVRHVCGYCNGSGLMRTEPHTTDANHD